MIDLNGIGAARDCDEASKVNGIRLASANDWNAENIFDRSV
jgi:hypothetical protein